MTFANSDPNSYMKYLTAYKNAVSSFLQYRMNLGLLLISHAFSLSGLMYLWIAIYDHGQMVGTYTLEGILFYYILLTILRTIIAEGVGIGFESADQIKDGVVTNYMLKPFSFGLEWFMKMLGKCTVNAVFIVPIVAILLFFFGQNLNLPEPIVWFQFIGMSLIGLVFYFLLYFLAAMGSFWLTTGRNAVFAMMVLGHLLNGSMIPLDLFPEWFMVFNTYSPFQFPIFIPIQAFLGRIESWSTVLLVAGVWILIFIGLITLLWKLGIKKYEAVGR